jgi:U4/U6.U5 tri-snRNP-associated protein 1
MLRVLTDRFFTDQSLFIEEESDQLVSVQLEERQKLKKNLENKKKKPIYTGYDDEEFNFGGGGIPKKNILSHYDEELEGTVNTSNS